MWRFIKINNIPKRVEDLCGQIFHNLTVISFVERKNNSTIWLCSCRCKKSKQIMVSSASLKSGNTKSCGCLKIEKCVITHTKHGLTESKEYKIWCGIKRRCYNKKYMGYKNYGGRGIKMCDRWLESFEYFYEDMGPRPSDSHSIDRIDNDGDYSKENCRWTTREEQNNNTSRNIYLTYNNVTKTISQWAKELNISSSTIKYRINKGWPVETIFAPSKKNGKHEN